MEDLKEFLDRKEKIAESVINYMVGKTAPEHGIPIYDSKAEKFVIVVKGHNRQMAETVGNQMSELRKKVSELVGFEISFGELDFLTMFIIPNFVIEKSTKGMYNMFDIDIPDEVVEKLEELRFQRGKEIREKKEG